MLRSLMMFIAALFAAHAADAQAPDFAARRAAMVDDIRAMYRMQGAASPDSRVLEALGRVPRHEFVPANVFGQAYGNHPLPIGEDQTISQPYIVAFMTDLARVRQGDKVLEVGTGSGYQAAILAELGATVHTIEILPGLAATARARLARLGYGKVSVAVGDGYEGIPAQAPFDAILVTAGASHVPPALVRQLKPGGRMVIPVGEARSVQELTLIEKNKDGSVAKSSVLAVRFVPLVKPDGGAR